ncbi:MAG: sulfotransferase [Bacteroidota bacterium]|nr:sulfotransferase [Bacteroidota bacterium]
MVQLTKRGEHFARTNNVLFDDVYPANVLEGLHHLVAALELPEARIRDDRKAIVAFGLTRLLRNRARLAREWQSHSAIRTERITRPIFIVGINRTGTTFLHRRLNQDPQFWAAKRYEMNEPVMPDHISLGAAFTKSDPRWTHYADVLKALDLARRFSGIHRAAWSGRRLYAPAVVLLLLD